MKIHKVISLSICVLALIVTTFLIGMHVGFDFGKRQGRESIYLSLTAEGELAKFYVRIWIGLLACLTGQFVRRALVSSTMSFLGLAFASYTYWMIYNERLLSFSSMDRPSDMLRFIFAIDLANSFLLCVLAALLFLHGLRYLRRKT